MATDLNHELLALVQLHELMARSTGRPAVRIGLIDGPIDGEHLDFETRNLRCIGPPALAPCAGAGDTACDHGTFVAGILAGRRGASAPAICPNCTILVRPIFRLGSHGASPRDLAAAILDCLDQGARILNLSLGLLNTDRHGERFLREALDSAARRGALVVAAAGNEGAIGSSLLTRHPWVLPVVACDRSGRPLGFSNLAPSIGRRGLRAPGEGVRSLRSGGGSLVSAGTSVAAPFVTGTLALLSSLFPHAEAATLRAAISASGSNASALIPGLLDAQSALKAMNRLSSTSTFHRRTEHGAVASH